MPQLKSLKLKFLKLVGFIRELCSKKTLKFIADQLYNPDQPDEVKAFSAAFGVFMGILPIWGFQTLAALFLSVVFKLNKTLVGIFLLISFPPMMPLIVFLSYRAGRYWMGNNITAITAHTKTSFQNINVHLEQYIYGSITLAIVAAAAFGLLTFVFLKLIKSLKQYRLTVSLQKA